MIDKLELVPKTGAHIETCIECAFLLIENFSTELVLFTFNDKPVVVNKMYARETVLEAYEGK